MANRIATLRTVVTRCGDCPHLMPSSKGLLCTHDMTPRKTDHAAPARFPDWCPLPLADDKGGSNAKG